MVKPFQFSRLPKIYFRKGIFAELPSVIKTFGNRILIVTGESSFLDSAYSQRLFDDLQKRSIEYHLLTISGEPSPEIIDTAVKEYHNERIDLIAGIGGGSVLDAGKAVSAMMYKADSVLAFLEGVGTREHPGTRLPYIAVPTTSGTGSEATKNAVLSRVGKGGFKRSLRHDNLVPDIALVDPELTLTCPRENTAASGMDCFTQLLESYLSDKAVEYTDALALEGLKAIKTSLLSAYQNVTDIEARTGMSFAALTSGICLANAGLGAVHGFASSIGGMYNIPHGLICGTLMASGNEINVRELRKMDAGQPALEKYALLGRLFSDESGKSDSYYTDRFIQFLHRLTGELNLPGFSEYGVEEKDVDYICSNTDIKNNPVKLTPEDLKDILRPRLL
jgi:alcohol dehydrogenase class IV